MKKFFTLLAGVLLAGSAMAQVTQNSVGLYRNLLEPNYYSEHKTATTGGIEVTTIMGSTTKDVDLDNDTNYGTSTEVARYHGVQVDIENGTGRIFPITEMGKLDPESYYGFKMSIPAGKSVDIEKLTATAFCGNAYNWQILITQGTDTIYNSAKLKCNAYNQKYCYMDSLQVTATVASGLSDAAKERTNVAPFGDSSRTEEEVMAWVGWKTGNYLTDKVKGLTGDVEVKMYYFNKVKKVFSVGDLYLDVTVNGSSSENPQISENSVGLYRNLLEPNYYSEHKTATTGGIEVTTIMGSTTKDVDLDNDTNYGTSTEVARYHGVQVDIENGTGRIFPITEMGKLDPESYYGFKMSIPAGKSVDIEKLTATAFCGNAYNWQILITQGTDTIYNSAKLKCNAYNQKYCYMDSLQVTATVASGLSDAAKERTNVAPFGDSSRTEEEVMAWVGWKTGNYLTDKVKGLTGDVEVKMYYFNKVKKVFSVGDLYLDVTVKDATGINTVPAAEKVADNNIYTIGGVYVGKDKSALTSGLYIQNGKKFVVK